MRLIDADLMKNSIENSDTDEDVIISPQELTAVLIRWIDNQPTVDAVEVVRCKDCEYDGIWCDIQDIEWTEKGKPIEFCSYGERKEDNEID